MINGVESREIDVIFGVPQGSVLGPRPYVIYINDHRQSSAYTVNLYAEVDKEVQKQAFWGLT